MRGDFNSGVNWRRMSVILMNLDGVYPQALFDYVS